MANIISNRNGQLMLLTAFLILIGVVFYTTILNAMVFSANMPSTGLTVSKQDISEFRLTTEEEIKAAVFTNTTNITGVDMNNETQVKAYFMSYLNSYIESIKKMYSERGASVEIILNNITINKTTTTLIVEKYSVILENHTYPPGSLVIPMDGNQTNSIGAYGLVYKIVDSSGTTNLTRTQIPVLMILQNAVNNSYNYTIPGFYLKMNTTINASASGPGINRNYSGGPFLIDGADLNEIKYPGIRQAILSEAALSNIKIHNLTETFTYEKSVKMVNPPKIAVYPKNNMGPMDDYYTDGEVPYTAISNTDILNGNLSKYDILTIPHHDMTGEPSNVIIEIVGWVSNGGFIHVECEGTDTMDTAIEKTSAGSAKPWYGFVGINKSKGIGDQYIKLSDNASKMNASSWFNNSPPMPSSGLADPGASYNILAQTNNLNGIFGTQSTGGSTTAFSLKQNKSQVNPDTNILGYAPTSYSYSADGLYWDYDSDGKKEPQLMYLEAPYDKGLVVYVAGHDLKKRGGDAERLIFESFFLASIRQEIATSTVVTVQNINITMKYFDGKVMFEDTFLIPIS